MNGETVHALRGVSLLGAAGRVRGHRRTVGQREVHPAPARRRDRRAERRQRGAAGDPARVARRPRAHPSSTHPARLRLPALSSPARAHRSRERRAPDGRGRCAGSPATGACAGAAGVRRAPSSRGAPCHPALRWRDAAGGDRPRARQPAGDPARRRAHRRARRRHRSRDPRPLPPAQSGRHHPRSWSPTTSASPSEAGRVVHMLDGRIVADGTGSRPV